MSEPDHKPRGWNASEAGKIGGTRGGARKVRDPQHYTVILPQARLRAKLARERALRKGGGMSRLAEQDQEDEKARQIRDGYRSFDYTGESCENCRRVRVMNCQNGKHVCEKCGWDADAHQYDPDFRT